MLNIYYGDMPEAVYDTASFFNHVYLDHWLDDPFSRKIIQSVDRSVVLSSHALDSRALGIISVKDLSGGTKTLLLMQHYPGKVFNASACGDNCAKWILEIARCQKKDLTINLLHMMDFGDKAFEIRILNNNMVVHSMSELVMTAGLYL